MVHSYAQAGNAQWWVTFAAAAVKEVVLTNRPQGRWRLRNIVVELLLDGKVVATSPILNPRKNILLLYFYFLFLF